MSDDLTSRVAALEVYVKNHETKLEEFRKSIEDIYEKEREHKDEYTQILLQMQGMCSEFSEFSVKLKEFNPIPEELHTHMTECKNYRDNDGFFKFWKNNPMIAGQFLFAGALLTILIVVLANSKSGMLLLKAGLSFFGVKL